MVMATEMPLPEGFHENSQIKELPIDGLKVDRSYQRVPSMTAVEKIAAEWNEVASELILVCDRGVREIEEDGGLYLVNGQHRTLAARKIGKKKIWARVVDLTRVEDPAAVEASLRLKTNVRLSDRPLERFKAQVRAGDVASLAIQRILERFGTQINESPDPDTGINAVGTVESLYAVDDGGTLVETLELLSAIYGELHGRAVSASAMKGYGWFVQQHSQETVKDRLVERMRLAGTEALYRRAIGMKSMMGGSEWVNYYRAIIDFYNDGLRDKSRLQPKMRGYRNFATRPSLTGFSSATDWGGGS